MQAIRYEERLYGAVEILPGSNSRLAWLELSSSALKPTIRRMTVFIAAAGFLGLGSLVHSGRTLLPTEREAVIRARRGQGLFKERVMQMEKQCRITKVDNPVHLIASHCKPWRDSDNQERLNGDNGLLLTPSIDHLFDRGFIGFEDNGSLIISPVAHRPSLERMGIDVRGQVNVGGFSAGQRSFLDFHRKSVLLKVAH
jgi:putative restriction endonuclease